MKEFVVVKNSVLNLSIEEAKYTGHYLLLLWTCDIYQKLKDSVAIIAEFGDLEMTTAPPSKTGLKRFPLFSWDLKLISICFLWSIKSRMFLTNYLLKTFHGFWQIVIFISRVKQQSKKILNINNENIQIRDCQRWIKKNIYIFFSL